MLDPVQCRRAHELRDARFDGRFFVGVKTTGIYCRPVCPAKTPLETNVTYWPSAAAAQAAGFRPCRRCRPERAPGLPANAGTGATVARALRLIDAGALDTGDVEALAERLGVSARHLRRCFEASLGAGPGAVAQTRRVLLARALLENTALRVSDVAVASGFGSVARLNAAVRAAFGGTPTSLRRGGAGEVLRLSFAARPPFPAGDVLAFYAARAIPGVGRVDGGAYTVAFPTRAGACVATLRPHEAGVDVAFRLEGLSALREAVARVRRALDLDASLDVLAGALGTDPALARALAEVGPARLVGHLDPFETLIRAIVGQQVSIAAARTLLGRLVASFGAPLPPSLAEAAGPADAVVRAFPTPEALAGADARSIGLPRARADAVATLARAVVADPTLLDPPVDVDAWARRLVALPGIGPWTAHYAALRAFAEPDAAPLGDLVVRRAYLTLCGETLTDAQLRARADAWRPFRGYASALLWAWAAKNPHPVSR